MKRQNCTNFRKGVFTLILSVIALAVSAQSLTVKGKVTDKNNDPIIGATVIVNGNTTIGAATDVDGNYTLPNVPRNASLK